MKIKNLFIFSLKTVSADLIIFLIGVFLSYGFKTFCHSTKGESCPQSILFFIGLILMLFSVTHFVVSLIVSKKFMPAIITIFVLGGCVYYFIDTLKIERLYDFPQASAIKFRLLDGDTGSPISNQEVYVCDDSMRIHYIGDYPLSRFCDKEQRKIITKANTDSMGILLLDIKNIMVKPPTSIVIDIGKSDDSWGKVEIERSDSLSHSYNQSSLRVLNQERDSHVVSNKFYNLDTKEVREIFTSDQSERYYTYDTIDLEIFIKK